MLKNSLGVRIYLALQSALAVLVPQIATATGSADHPQSITIKHAFGQSHVQVRRCHNDAHAGLLVVLHGRGGHAAAQLSTMATQFKAVACKRNLALVVPEAASANRNWPFERAGGDKQDQFLNELLEKKIPTLVKIKKPHTTFFVGISAGATFLMGDFYPRHAQRYSGAAIALCGGSWPTDTRQLTELGKFKKMPLAIRISEKDFLFRQARAGIVAYEKARIPVYKRITSESGHCAFSMDEATEEALSQIAPVPK